MRILPLFVIVLASLAGSKLSAEQKPSTSETAKTAEGEAPKKPAKPAPESRPATAPATGEAGSAIAPSPGTSGTPNTPASLRIHLLEGSIISGQLSVDKITVTTEFGTLEVPVASIVSFTPGLDSHPQEKVRLTKLIQQLGSNSVTDRDSAQRQLVDMGPGVRPHLQKYTTDADNERKTRVQKILAEFEESDGDEEAVPMNLFVGTADDTVETARFTVVGKISPTSFQVQTPFGPLQLALSDIRRVVKESNKKNEIRKTVNVTGMNLAQTNYVNTGIRIERGDKLQINADGSIVMTPWGNNVSSTPEGGENFQWFVPNEIAGGALVGRIGATGKPFKVGTKYSTTVTKPGILYLAVGMNAQYATQGYQFPGEYHARIRVNASDAK